MVFPRLIFTNTRLPSARLMTQETRAYLETFHGPAHIFWGRKDPFFPIEALTAWRKRLPQAEVTEFADAEQHIQEDRPDEMIKRLIRFLADI